MTKPQPLPKIFGLPPQRVLAAMILPAIVFTWLEYFTLLALFPILWVLMLKPDGAIGRAVDRLFAAFGPGRHSK